MQIFGRPLASLLLKRIEQLAFLFFFNLLFREVAQFLVGLCYLLSIPRPGLSVLALAS